ncbi:DUF983 domain-containing protein [Fulvimarina endophytica]|uniref:DUF983 domain-containing protein n=1 Tax=Fulvimarina endophytica TaxID=2293836 RepID=A0A371X5Q8_9HYPH|nr:DUF983 domain-containing protein [Fulvimarina endophytica]RFC64557.1 DUF983 domain-containing protein [Fulvimarina endophytica]
MSETGRSEPDPVRAGLAGRCPHCGEGRLFAGFLKPARSCDVCGLDYGFADTGDGPVVFVILIIGFLVCGLALWLQVAMEPPLYVHFLIWLPLAVILTLPLMRLLKGVTLTLTYANRAREGRIETPADRGASHAPGKAGEPIDSPSSRTSDDR